MPNPTTHPRPVATVQYHAPLRSLIGDYKAGPSDVVVSDQENKAVDWF